MTINEFWRELNERENLEKLRIPFEHYTWIFYQENKRFMNVGIDLFQWLLQHATIEQTLSRLPSGSDEICTIVSGIASKLRYMQSLPINFVVVIDGTIKNDKLRNIDGQQTENDYVFEELFTIVEQQVSNKEYIMNGALLNKVVEYLKAANIEYIFATGDAEIELARLNHLNVIDGIISNDADSFAYGAKLVFRNFSKNKLDNPQTGKGKDQTSNVYVTPISLDLLKKHGLGTDEIMFLALCQGDDYSNGMKSLGIKKAWNLATKKLASFDAVGELKRIYLREEENDKKKLFYYDFDERKRALKLYESALNQYIRNHAQTLFGQRHNIEVSLPSDYVIASHFLPYYTKQIFLGSLFTGSQNSCKRNNVPLTAMKKVDWKRFGRVGSFPFSIKRGNDLYGNLGESLVFEKQLSKDTLSENNIEALDWFSKLKYPQILDASRTTRNKLTGYEYLVDELGRCFVWKAIVCIEDLELGPDDIYIKSEKQETFEFNSKRYNFKKYQVMVKKRQVFKRYVQLRLYDDDLNPIEEKSDYVWIPEFMFKEHPSAKKLLQDYNTKKSSPKKKTPKKSKEPIQTTNLDFWSKSPKSPFKMSVKKSESLDLTGVTTISLKHPNEEEQLLSPRKKSKVETEKELDEIKAGEDSFSYSLDAETSRVLGVSSIDEIPELPDPQTIKDLYSDLNGSKSSTASETSKKMKVPEKMDEVLDFILGSERAERHRLAVKRGPSDLDMATRLPSVPADHENEPDYLNKFMSEKDDEDNYLKDPRTVDSMRASASFTEDSFTDTDGAIEDFLQQEEGKVDSKQNQSMSSKVNHEVIISDDTFSDDIDLEMIETTPTKKTAPKEQYIVENTSDDNVVVNCDSGDDMEVKESAAGFSTNQNKLFDTTSGVVNEPTHQIEMSDVAVASINSSYLSDLDNYQTASNPNTGFATEECLSAVTIEEPIIVQQSHHVKKEDRNTVDIGEPIIINGGHKVIDLTLESDDDDYDNDSVEEIESTWKFKLEEGMVLAENTDDEELFISAD